MISIDAQTALTELGLRLKAARVQRNETQALFAARIGVAIPTLRDMEQGKATVQIGAWINALWALDRLSELNQVLATQATLFDRLAAIQSPQRQRPHTRRRPRKSAK